jgi:LmbE family N-acetylglucosaminyl deacetylase
MTILVIAAHPDDEVLGCGGAIAKLSAREGIHIGILGEGMSSRSPQRSQADAAELNKLQSDARDVANLLGARSVLFENLPDNRFDELPLLDVIKRVERLIEELQPDAIYTHHPGDLNIDHLVTFRAVLTATRPTVGCAVKEIYCFEVPSSTEWSFQRIEPIFRPNIFVDIKQTIERKIQAMETYTSEARAFPHPRSSETLRAIAQRWGSVVGVECAEAFELIRSIR